MDSTGTSHGKIFLTATAILADELHRMVIVLWHGPENFHEKTGHEILSYVNSFVIDDG